MTFTLTSRSFNDGDRLPEAQVFEGMGYCGGNISPPLAWQDPPAGTKSFAITMYDPDAPTGSGWWHWVVINIPADVTSLPAGAGSGDNSLPEHAEMTRTDFGGNVYGGAAPPPGPEHHYIFTIHALDIAQVELPNDASGAMVGFVINQHSLGSARLTAVYGKKPK
ncbi:kinase inhibitor [Komagataeibacter xylinus]|uniref:Kinase inhibitor n=1 Tax=Komagataeibacter xylinus TaxID=28448 RepID=A0A318PGU7_KOMXY|nr:kinase inhibitor [Komagataeibacter xylinus]AZV39329.1 kinase inhibitor [Komagataeibacter xylinus]PYD56470.1 kinase inhibitor [Komagataeibacter xylinus]GBQ81566.1 kinase inhibitor phospholipid-binding protein [Komagataeibacter xylinus NBRC 15237]